MDSLHKDPLQQSMMSKSAMIEREKRLCDIKSMVHEAVLKDAKIYDIAQDALKTQRSQTVYPQIQPVDFYRRYEVFDHEYEPSRMTEPKNINDAVDKEQILRNFQAGHITFVGSAGTGKTTLLKSIARDIAEGRSMGLKPEIEVVHYLEGRNFGKDKMQPVDFLLQNVDIELSSDDKKMYYGFVKNNPEKVMIILDSLDTLPYSLDEDSKTKSNDDTMTSSLQSGKSYFGARATTSSTKYHHTLPPDMEEDSSTGEKDVLPTDECDPATLLRKLLQGRLFPGIRVITSSREYAIRNYKGKLRPDKVYALVGFTDAQITKIVGVYLDEDKAKTTVEYLQKCPKVMGFCTIPLMLAFTLIGYDYDPDFTPSTVSGILMNALCSLVRSPHCISETINEGLTKLAHLSFTGIKERRLLFSTSELEKYGLDANKLTGDFTIVAPTSGRRHRLVEFETSLYCSHQCIQEMLAAIHVLRMECNLFIECIEEYIHTGHFTFVRRILCGIMFDQAARGMYEEVFQEKRNLDDKQTSLRRSLKKRFEQKPKKNDLIELIMACQESRGELNDVFSSSLRSMIVEDATISDVEAVVSALSCSPYLDELNLRQSNVSTHVLEVLVTKIQTSPPEVVKLRLDFGRLDCEGMRIAGKMTSLCRVKILEMVDLSLNKDGLSAFKSGSEGAKINSWDISQNSKMDARAFQTIGEIVKMLNVLELHMRICNLTNEKLVAFRDSAKGAKINSWDISVNDCMDRQDFQTIGEIVKMLNVLELIMERCYLTWDKLVSFRNSAKGAKMISWDISNNRNMDRQAFQRIGEIVKMLNVLELTMGLCDLTREKLVAFRDSAEGAKLLRLNLSVNPMDEHTLPTVVDIVKKCDVEILEMRRCKWSYEKSRMLKKSLREKKLRILDLSAEEKEDKYFHVKGSWTGTKNIQAILSLLDNVTGKMIIEDQPIDAEEQAVLQRQLDLCQNKDLRVIIGDGEELKPEICAHDESPVQESEEETPGSKPKRPVLPKPQIGEEDNKEVDVSCLLECDDMDKEEYYVAEKPFSAEVEPHGQELKINDCVIKFPKNSFDKTTKVDGKLEIDKSKWPKDYIIITSMIYVKAHGLLLCPSSVQAASWCINNGSDVEKNTMVHVLHLPDGHDEWEVLCSLPLTADKFFKFDCVDFSPVAIGIHEEDLGSQLFIIDVCVYATSANTFTVAFCISDKLILNELEKDMSRSKFTYIDKFNSIDAKLGDVITANLTCIKPARFSFIPDGDFTFSVDVQFLQMRKPKVKKSVLENAEPSADYRRVVLQYESFKNGEPTDSRQGFSYEWRTGKETVMDQTQRLKHSGEDKSVDLQYRDIPSTSDGGPAKQTIAGVSATLTHVEGGHASTTYKNSLVTIITGGVTEHTAPFIKEMSDLRYHSASKTMEPHTAASRVDSDDSGNNGMQEPDHQEQLSSTGGACTSDGDEVETELISEQALRESEASVEREPILDGDDKRRASRICRYRCNML